jgi:hypothetical protein
MSKMEEDCRELHELCKKVVLLLDDPHWGLSTWLTFLTDNIGELGRLTARITGASSELEQVRNIVIDGLQNAVDRLPDDETRLVTAAKWLVETKDAYARVIVRNAQEILNLQDEINRLKKG